MDRSREIQVQELRDRVHHDADRIDETFRVGVEIEACLLDKKGGPVNAEPLIKELEGNIYEIDYEYGSCQFEYKTSPVGMDILLVNGDNWAMETGNSTVQETLL